MKTIYAALDPQNFYKAVIDDQTLEKIKEARKWLDTCPFNGELSIPFEVVCLNSNKKTSCYIIVFNYTINIMIKIFDGEDHLLEWGDDLFKLPDVYVTRRFQIMYEDAEKYLSESDKQFIASWNASK